MTKLTKGALIMLPVMAWFLTFFMRGIWTGLWDKLIVILNAFGLSTPLAPLGLNLFSVSIYIFGTIWLLCGIIWFVSSIFLHKRHANYKFFLLWLGLFSLIISIEFLVPSWFSLVWRF
ncbi:MAG: hypothetical protein ACTSSI_08445 [Candidatus Helarchaeota archaeon]